MGVMGLDQTSGSNMLMTEGNQTNQLDDCGLVRGSLGAILVPIFTLSVDTPKPRSDNRRLGSAEGYPSGQRGQTVNLLAMPS